MGEILRHYLANRIRSQCMSWIFELQYVARFEIAALQMRPMWDFSTAVK